jgi:DNA-binding NtrC family response regulator
MEDKPIAGNTVVICADLTSRWIMPAVAGRGCEGPPTCGDRRLAEDGTPSENGAANGAANGAMNGTTSGAPSMEAGTFDGAVNLRFDIPHGVTLEEIERAAVLQALAGNAGNRTRAARALGISVRTLQRRLKRWQEQP